VANNRRHPEWQFCGQWSDFTQNVFGGNMWLNNIFCAIFGRSATMLAINPQMKFQKLRQFWIKIPQIGIFVVLM
jgi:hypothetical protein